MVSPAKIKHSDITGISISRDSTIGMIVGVRNRGSLTISCCADINEATPAEGCRPAWMLIFCHGQSVPG